MNTNNHHSVSPQRRTQLAPCLPLSPNMHKIDIFLHDNDCPAPFLSIPEDDIRRLSLAPHRWLTFAMFTICGAHGVLTATPGGPPVNLDATFPDLLGEYYYFVPNGKRFLVVTLHSSHIFAGTPLAFVDHRVLDDRVTSTPKTLRSRLFRNEVKNRDGGCVMTRRISQFCDATHIIPLNKGSQVCLSTVLGCSCFPNPVW